MDLSLASFASRLADTGPAKEPSWLEHGAAVAMLLRFERGAADLLLMRRIVRAGDPWSGQVSLPGGGAKGVDQDAVDTATREAREEVGVDLGACARVLGFLAPVRPVPRGFKRPLFITPVVFAQTEPATVQVGSEATTAFWLPLDQVAAGALDSTFRFRIGFITKDFPCWRYQGEVVWGLTYQMVTSLLQLVTGRA